MRVALGILPRNDAILQIGIALRALGHEVRTLSLEPYASRASYAAKKLDRLGWKEARRRFDAARLADHLAVLHTWRPQRLLFVSLPDDVFSYADMCEIRRAAQDVGCALSVWHVDVCERTDAVVAFCALFDRVCSYERKDAEWLSAHGLPARFCPVGYAEAYATPAAARAAEHDILFIGTPYRARVSLLGRLARESAKRGWRLCVVGSFWERQYPWKKLLFRLRHPALYACVRNGTVSPAQAAALYARSRICLNLHREDAGGCNPRTYEILAAGGMEILDAREDYDILSPGRDMETFRTEAELLEKIAYYLSHEAERASMARCGKKTVWKRRATRELLQNVLS